MSGKELKNAVGPVVRAGEVGDAVLEALREDNPGKEFVVEDHIAYVRIETEGECVIRQVTLSRLLGREITMAELEIDLTSFSGRIDTDDRQMRFYLAKTL